MDPEDGLHVLVMADSDEVLETASHYVEQLMYNDTERDNLKRAQLAKLGITPSISSFQSPASVSGGSHKIIYVPNDRVCWWFLLVHFLCCY